MGTSAAMPTPRMSRPLGDLTKDRDLMREQYWIVQHRQQHHGADMDSLSVRSWSRPHDGVAMDISIGRVAIAEAVRHRIIAQPQRKPHGDPSGPSPNDANMR